MDLWDGSALRLVADNDLTYHHSVEVTFTDVVWVSSADLFHHPVFRLPTRAEREFARQVAADEVHQLFAWDAETATGDRCDDGRRPRRPGCRGDRSPLRRRP